MTTTPLAITLVGATGLTGSAALSSILQSPTSITLTTLTRRPLSHPLLSNSHVTLIPRIYNDLRDAHAPSAESISSVGGVYISCLGTTKANAGGLDKQNEIDVVLNRELAKKAKEDGAETMILVSSTGANSKSHFPYLRMKGQLEEQVQSLGFKNLVILRPATLMGQRKESRFLESVAVNAIRGLGKIGLNTLSIAIEADDVGKAIAHLAIHPPDGVSFLSDPEIYARARAFEEWCKDSK